MSARSDVGDRMFSHYHLGATTTYAARADSRVSYTLYVPRRLARMDRAKTRILVSVHGTGRMQALYRDMFAEFSEYNNCIVLAPLFPANLLGDGNLSGYKFLREGDIRYDLLLLDMVGEAVERYGIQPGPLLLFGFSGGAHFAHRFTLLHPERVAAVSIGSPGVVTLADPAKPWWIGTAGAEQLFGQAIDPDRLAGKPVHFVVGGADRETWEITLAEGDKSYMPGINDAGADRPERIASLRDSFSRSGALTRLDVVADAAHDVTHVVHTARMFFADVIAGVFVPDEDQ